MLGPGFEYTYSISSDFPLGEVNIALLEEEIRVSTIKAALRGVSTKGDVCNIIFVTELDTDDKTVLDGNTSPPSGSSIIGSHDGNPTPEEELWFAESEKEYKTNRTEYVDTLTLNVPLIPSGSYYIHWGFNLSAAKYNKDVKYRIVLDGVTVLLEKEVSPALSMGDGGWKGASIEHSFFTKRALTEGSHSIAIQFASSHKSQTASLSAARIELMQV